MRERENLSPGPAAIRPEVAKEALHKAAKEVGYHQAMARIAQDRGDKAKAKEHFDVALGFAIIIDQALGKYTPAWLECYAIGEAEWNKHINPVDPSRN